MKDETATADHLVALVARRAENLFDARRLCCSEAVLVVFNRTFRGGLEPERAVALGSGFCGGIGDAGCLCGSLAGAVAGLGLFLSPARSGGLKKKRFRHVCREAHDRFREQAGAVCCRELIRDYANDRQGRHRNCAALTGLAAGIAAELLLRSRPALAGRADLEYLRRRDSRFLKTLV